MPHLTDEPPGVTIDPRTPVIVVIDAILTDDPIGWSVGIAADRRLTINPTPRTPTAEHAAK